MTVVLTADIEDWAQSTLNPDLPIYPRAQRNTERLLDIVTSMNRKMTCFVLGRFAEEFPETVKRMANDGHEVASHGYGHVNIYEQTPEEFRADIRRSKDQLEQLIGKPVTGYRGPCFSLGAAGDWPLEILAEEGFLYDSSIFPSPTYRNGRSNWPAHPVKVVLPSGREIFELPAATLKVCGRVLPVAGGGYHRLLPWPAIRWCIRKSLLANQVFTLYCHPYEFDPDEFSYLPIRLSLKVKLHQGLGRKGFESKFRKILTHYDTATAIHTITNNEWPVHRLTQVN